MTVRLLAILVLLLLLTACKGEQQPGALRLRTMQFGNPGRCRVQLYDANGQRLIDEQQSDSRGNLELKELMPGTYTLKFRDMQGRAYSAERSFSISAGKVVQMEVELTEEQAGGNAASTEGK
jgi:hypothetical protein